MKIQTVIKHTVKRLLAIIALICLGGLQNSCKKLIDIKPPVSSITTTQVFADSTDAVSAIEGIYTVMTTGYDQITNGFSTIYPGMSADELLPFQSQGSNFPTNTLLIGDNDVQGCWGDAYTLLYQVNASIEGLTASKGLSQAAKNQLTGEAKFIRALYYFYLTNLFGNVPLITTSNYKVNAVAARTPQATVYAAIVSDLLSAQSLLSKDYSYSGGARIRANSSAATALLARVYLYQKQWQQAETEADTIINNTATFNLAPDLNQVFTVNSSEAILQLNLNTSFGSYNATAEAVDYEVFDNTSPPLYYLTPQLLNAFETGDMRRQDWVDSTTYNGVNYYYPYKYKIGVAQESAGAPATELYTVLRLAEQYLIRAEARAEQQNLSGAIADINVIRNRAGLPGLATNLDQAHVLAAVYQERRIELFAEWGHRWLDLKRTNQANSVLGNLKPTWQSYQQLYPIPNADIISDPNLTQNPGYH